MIRSCHLLVLVVVTACVEADPGIEPDQGWLVLASCPPGGDPRCIPGHLVDMSPAPGLQPECAVSVLLAADVEPLEYAVPPCTLTGGALPCFQPVVDRDVCAETPTGLRMEVLHAWGDDVLDTTVQCVERRRR